MTIEVVKPQDAEITTLKAFFILVANSAEGKGRKDWIWKEII